MTYGPEERVWEGETCFHCGKDLHGEAIQYGDMYFCSEECFGAHLIEEKWPDNDGGLWWYNKHGRVVHEY